MPTVGIVRSGLSTTRRPLSSVYRTIGSAANVLGLGATTSVAGGGAADVAGAAVRAWGRGAPSGARVEAAGAAGWTGFGSWAWAWETQLAAMGNAAESDSATPSVVGEASARPSKHTKKRLFVIRMTPERCERGRARIPCSSGPGIKTHRSGGR